MRIKLELDEFRFVTMSSFAGEIRVLLVEVGGKPFCVYRTMDPPIFRNKLRDEQVDRILIETMQAMLEKILTDACGAIPEGTEILGKEGK